mmetsp:Transcript_31519/g.94302  ORF Transcript_31519/g.94302 Transcript_31519/m.94302 type:complete len:92 (-) Transcript_31519:82-357(-)
MKWSKVIKSIVSVDDRVVMDEDALSGTDSNNFRFIRENEPIGFTPIEKLDPSIMFGGGRQSYRRRRVGCALRDGRPSSEAANCDKSYRLKG